MVALAEELFLGIVDGYSQIRITTWKLEEGIDRELELTLVKGIFVLFALAATAAHFIELISEPASGATAALLGLLVLAVVGVVAGVPTEGVLDKVHDCVG